jgi:glycosyltransferase involved in cell wall biosynthesis
MRAVWISFFPGRPARAPAGSSVLYAGPGANRHTLLEGFAGASAAVFSRLPDASMAQPVLELADTLAKRGTKIVVDCTDDHFEHPTLGSLFRALLQAADSVVANSHGLAEALRTQTLSRVSVIGDAVEGERGEPRAALRRPPRLLWFGQAHNLDALRTGLEQLRQLFALTVVSSPGSGAETLGHRFVTWSAENLAQELRECDAVLLPAASDDPRNVVRSASRFQQALWAGRFVIANPIPAYAALGRFGWVGPDLAAGLAWLFDNSDAAVERIRAGQDWVAEHASPQAIARAWSAVTAKKGPESVFQP